LDGSDVWRLDLGHSFAPHLSTGLSARYFTPVGPLRADIGLRIPGLQELGVACPVYDPGMAWGGPHTCTRGQTPAPGGNYLAPQYGQAGSVLGLPLALALSFGESF
jgi:outer membrane protein insertion porin family/translocation and assembly module TamA